jgi:FixJ family two-component response regulator
MVQSAAVLCRDKNSLKTLKSTLDQLRMPITNCRTRQDALDFVMSGRCSALIVDFDLPGADEVIRMAALLPPPQKPALLAVASQAWPGTGKAFQSGANRILYRPLAREQVKDALKSGHRASRVTRRKSARYELRTIVHLDLGDRSLSGVSLDIGEHGLAVQATEPVPISNDLHFRCVLPGTDVTLQGHAEVIWASDQGRAGLFFSKLAPAARKHLKQWLSKRAHANHSKNKDKHTARELLPPADAHVSFSAAE